MGKSSSDQTGNRKIKFKNGKRESLSMLKPLPIALISILFFSAISFAGSIQQTNMIYLSPFYRQSMTNNQDYNYTLNLNPSDGITNVYSAIVRFDVFLTPSVNFTLKINNQNCNTPNYYVSTTYASSSQSRITFDCSNIIKKFGNYTLTLRASGANTGAVTGWADITYSNNPPSVSTGGTEYSPNDVGTVYVTIMDGNSRAVNLATCNSTIYYPNKTVWVNNSPLTLLANGIYYKDVMVPSLSGVYITYFSCAFPAGIFIQNRTAGFDIGASLTSFVDDFPFDNFNNITINSAWIYFSVTGGGGGASVDYYFNGAKIGSGSGVSESLNVTLNQNNFTIGDLQHIAVVRTGLSSTVNWVILYANYTASSPTQIVRGQTEIHVGTLYNSLASLFVKPYTILSLCGSKYASISSRESTADSTCAKFVNDTDYNLPEGAIEDNVTVTALQTQSAYFTYTTPEATSCNALYWIKTNITGTWQTLYNSSLNNQTQNGFILENSLSRSGGCDINVPINLTTNSSQSYIIRYDNFQKYKTIQSYNLVSSTLKNIFDSFCIDYGNINNYTFTVPILNSTILSNDSKLLTCHKAYDIINWNSIFYGQSLTVSTVGEYQTFFVEMVGYNEPELHRYSEGMIGIKSSGGYIISTLCGVSFESDGFGTCAKITDDNEFNLVGGEIEDNVTVTALQTQSTYWKYFAYSTCDFIDWIKLVNPNGTLISNVNLSKVLTISTTDTCQISIPLNMTSGTTYNYQLKIRNVMKIRANNSNIMMDGMKNQTDAICLPYGISHNYTYTVPIMQNTNISTDPTLFLCHNIYDTFFIEKNLFFYPSQNVNTIGEYIPYYNNIISIESNAQNYFQILILSQNVSYNSTLYDILANQQTIYNYQQASNQSLSNQISDINISVSGNITANVNQTYFDIQFNKTWNNQSTIFNFLSAMNSTMTTFHNDQMNLLTAINNTVTTIYNWIEYKSQVMT